MFKIMTILFILLSSIYAKDTYEIKYNGIKVGDISNLSTIKDGYLKAEATTYLKFFVWYDYLIIHEESYKKDTSKKDIKYKKDTNHILELLKELEFNKPRYKTIHRKKIILKIECKNNICKYTRIDKKTNKLAQGKITYKNNKLYEIEDFESDLIIKLNK
jgi:hypothetical protein